MFTITNTTDWDAQEISASDLESLRDLNNDIDQAASMPRDIAAICPEAKTLLELAWWFTESAIREATGQCSFHALGGCPCCKHFERLTPRANGIKARIL